MEKDDEVKGEGNAYTTHFRAYDSRLGRWKSIDPAFKSLAGYSTYNFSLNSPIILNDPRGDCPPGVDCENPLENMNVRANRASNLGPGLVRNFDATTSTATRPHDGHDLVALQNTDVNAVMNGVVHATFTATGNTIGYGSYITLKHFKPLTEQQQRDSEDPNRAHLVKLEVAYYTFYSHLDQIGVSIGDAVLAGDYIGDSGLSGRNTTDEPHLHFEIGTELRSPTSNLLLRTSLVDPNTAYNNVEFESQDTETGVNQTTTGIIKTVTENPNGTVYDGGVKVYKGDAGTAPTDLKKVDFTVKPTEN